MTKNVNSIKIDEGFPPCFLCFSGPRNNKLGPDIIKWQYRQVMNVKTGLKISLAWPSSGRQEVTRAGPETLRLNA